MGDLDNINFEDLDFGGSTSGFDDDFGEFDFGDSQSNNSNNDFGDFSFDTDESNSDNSWDDFTTGSSDTSNQGNQGQAELLANIDGMFDSNIAANKSNNSSTSSVKKSAIILIVVGVVVIIIAVIAGSAISRNKNKKENVYNNVEIVQPTNQQIVQNNNVNSIMSSEQAQYPVVNTVPNSSNQWKEITNSEQIEFNSEYTDLVFTITDIKHYAMITDNNVVTKTTLKGSLSGLSGTYSLEIPYNKGVLLSVGNEFSVNVLIGYFNGKMVIGDIKY